ncbi:serine/threonine protein phosphatase [Pseudooceanicola sediminis]|uniref:Serine/threonine protein phosphatase n=2 Tax=Pseudooceanicola sediminis TaxID=2211117 RepID=A0A399IVW2_9RHOB|nr:serine/threonine protein phosphatase [Puniceibacterium sp. HSS470]RII37154.1 serine/threonine protein phosphatase [Pseudooceanicola sediminis]
MRFLTRFRAPKPTFSSPLAPGEPFFAIGDIHGCDHLMPGLLERIDEIYARQQDQHEARNGAPWSARLVFVGDYVDRGDQSAAVLHRLQALQRDHPSTLCLMGNHEQMLLQFLDTPGESGPRWMRYGGLQTMASFGVAPPAATAPADKWEEARDRFRTALGAPTEAWLRALPLIWQTGNVIVVHAGADPARPPAKQSEATLLWGHSDFTSTPRTDGLWVVHGHTIVEQPRPEMGRLPVDTGAYATGRLTAALISPGKVEFTP